MILIRAQNLLKCYYLVTFVRNRGDTHQFNNQLLLIVLLKPKASVVLVVAVFLFGIVTIIQSNLAYATASEKIFLVQQYEQFPGQEITGFCNLERDDEGNLHWRVKVNGLVPETRGHFDMNGLAGEVNVPYTADDDGKADSKNQIVLAANVPYSLFYQFAKCHVHVSGDYTFTNPIIALGVQGSSNADADENKKPIPTEKKFFLFYFFEYVIEVLKNNNVDAFGGFNSVFGPPPTNNPSTSNTPTISIGVNEDTKKMSTGNHPIKAEKNSTKINPNVTVIKEGKGTSDKGTSDKGNGDNGGEPKRCNPGKQKKGSC
jgi:hypothetical protein